MNVLESQLLENEESEEDEGSEKNDVVQDFSNLAMSQEGSRESKVDFKQPLQDK